MRSDVIDWLLDADPAVRWQVMRDLAQSPAEMITATRSRVAWKVGARGCSINSA
jgi:hypothetical protein